MKKSFIFAIAIALYLSNAKADPTGVPAECKNLAVMETQLLMTAFHTGVMGDGTYNPKSVTLQTNNGLTIGKIEYLGGDGEDPSKQGQYPCDKDPNLCTNPADAGGSIDWSRVTVQMQGADIAEVIVSMGGRGGCSLSSGKSLVQ